MEDWITIRNLKSHNSKLGTREIAKQLNVSRNTVKKALLSESPPEYKRNKKENTDIEPFKDYIIDGLYKRNLICSRILSDIKAKGYKGSKSAFYRYASNLESKEKRTYHPYETGPGEQAQFDWSPYTVVINGELTRVYVFSYILGFSRYRVYEASLTQTLGSTIDALENSIIETGGTPERIQTDNAGCFVTNSSKENFKWNTRYLHFCGHYGIKPTRSLPAHPWSKGKVENTFHFLEEHFIKGNEFNDFDDFLVRLKGFQDEVNLRVHSTIKQPPVKLYESEKQSFGKLPESRFVDIKEEVRKVTADCLISFQGSRYSVPYLFATKEVWLKIAKGYRLLIYSSQNKLIAEHNLSLKKGQVIMNEKHYKDHTIERGNWERLTQSFVRLFPGHEWFVDKLKTQKKINPNYHLTQIIEIARYYNNDDVKSALQICQKYNAYNYLFIKGYLEKNGGFKLEPVKTINTKLLTPPNDNGISRSLSEYKLIKT